MNKFNLVVLWGSTVAVAATSFPPTAPIHLSTAQPRLTNPQAVMRREKNKQTPQGASLSVDSQINSPLAIDFVYCWAGEAVQHDGGGLQPGTIHGGHNQGEGFGEIRWSLKMLEAHAPWFHKVHILVNTPADRPPWLTEASQQRIAIVDRCQLFDKPEDCPTQNTHSCQSVMHKIPNLAEHFVAMQDDFLLINPTLPSDFFTDGGKPLVLPAHAEDDVPMYDAEPPGPDMPPTSRPTRCGWYHHLPIPMLQSFALQLEIKYPDWFAFVRSHHTRFQCCNASKRANGLDEDFQRIYPHMLLRESVGVQQTVPPWATCTNPNLATVEDSSGQKKQNFQHCTVDKIEDTTSKFMVIQNIAHEDTWFMVSAALRKKLENYPKSEFVSDDPEAIDSDVAAALFKAALFKAAIDPEAIDSDVMAATADVIYVGR